MNLQKSRCCFSSRLRHCCRRAASIRLPAVSQRVDYEGELGIVIGRSCYKLKPEEDVRPYIRGYVIVNDVTARDLQKSDGQWSRAKGFDTFCPVGPIVSDAVDPEAGITVTTRLNGAVKQHGSTMDFIFNIATLLRYISAAMTLNPGDLIPTGTPAGVGPMQSGDVVEVEIDGLGSLAQSCPGGKRLNAARRHSRSSIGIMGRAGRYICRRSSQLPPG